MNLARVTAEDGSFTINMEIIAKLLGLQNIVFSSCGGKIVLNGCALDPKTLTSLIRNQEILDKQNESLLEMEQTNAGLLKELSEMHSKCE